MVLLYAFLLDLVLKHNQTIERLDIRQSNLEITSRVLEQTESFNQLYALFIEYFECDTNTNIMINLKLNSTSFRNLQYLEIGINHSTVIDEINNILQFTSNSLRAVKFQYRASGDHFFGPSNIEWVCMAKMQLTLDLTECDKLIGVVLLCVDGQRILWPKDDKRLIPFVYLSDLMYVVTLLYNQMYKHDYWKWKILNKEIMAKFVLLKKAKTENKDRERDNHADLLLFNDDQSIKRISIDEYMLKSDVNNDKCLVLKKEDMNEQLFDKIMKYAIKDDNRRNIKCKVYNK